MEYYKIIFKLTELVMCLTYYWSLPSYLALYIRFAYITNSVCMFDNGLVHVKRIKILCSL